MWSATRGPPRLEVMNEFGFRLAAVRYLSCVLTAVSIVASGLGCTNSALWMCGSGAAGASVAPLRVEALERYVNSHSQHLPSTVWDSHSDNRRLARGLAAPGASSSAIVRGGSALWPPSPFQHPAFAEGKTNALSATHTRVPSSVVLNLEETDDCILAELPPPNAVGSKSDVEAKVTLWGEHVNDETHLRDTLKAYQTTETPGREREFALSFAIPDKLLDSGRATLTLTKIWDGREHGWDCPEHILQIIRLSDSKYQEGRNALSQTTDLVEYSIGIELGTFQVDVSSLVYGKNLQNELHLLVREKNMGCLSSFARPGSEGGVVLTVQTEDSENRDATYGEWSNFSPCRVSCITSVNFQCRKRSCSPGTNEGAQCLAHLMVDKQPCSDPTLSACSCDALVSAKACPAGSYCDASKLNDVKCVCPGVFTRNSVLEPTVCKLTTSSSSSLLGGSSAGSSGDSFWGSGTSSSSSISSLQNNDDGSQMMILWIVMGVVLSLICLGCLALVCCKKKPPSEEDLLCASIDPYTGQVSTAGAGIYGSSWTPALSTGGGPVASYANLPKAASAQRGSMLHPSGVSGQPQGAGVRRSVSGWQRGGPNPARSGSPRQMGY